MSPIDYIKKTVIELCQSEGLPDATIEFIVASAVQKYKSHSFSSARRGCSASANGSTILKQVKKEIAHFKKLQTHKEIEDLKRAHASKPKGLK